MKTSKTNLKNLANQLPSVECNVLLCFFNSMRIDRGYCVHSSSLDEFTLFNLSQLLGQAALVAGPSCRISVSLFRPCRSFIRFWVVAHFSITGISLRQGAFSLENSKPSRASGSNQNDTK